MINEYNGHPVIGRGSPVRTTPADDRMVMSDNAGTVK